MSNEEYQLLGALNERSKIMDVKVDKILEQTIKTNGRVTELETWKKVITGQKNLLVAIGSVAAGVIGWLLHHIFQ